MSPEHAAAHLVAKHLREIAALLPQLEPTTREVLVNAYVLTENGNSLTFFAERLEATAPFEPVTDEQRAAIREQHAESIGDLNYRERADLVTEGWTEAEWRMEQDDQDEYMREDGTWEIKP